MKNSRIGWTEHTINFHEGCEMVSDGCTNCYMFRDMTRYGKNPNVVRRTADATFYKALKWTESALIFTCSWSDFFIEQADEWRADAWEVIKQTPHHQWQILTKRSHRIKECLPDDWNDGYDNVWLGVSVENYKKRAVKRIEELRAIPAKVHFLSLEPLLSPLNNLDLRGMEWVILGGESGNNTGRYQYRPSKLAWFESIIAQANDQKVPVYVKQLGTYLAKQLGGTNRHGTLFEDFPLSIRVQDYPTAYTKPVS